MRSSIGPYQIENSPTFFRLSKKHSSKDWLDIFVSIIMGTMSVIAVIFIINERLLITFNWLLLFICLIFSFVAFLKLSYAVTRLLEPTQNIILVNKTTRIVTFGLTQFQKLKVHQSELKLIKYQLNKEVVKSSENQFKDKYWIDVKLITKDKSYPLFIINPTNFIDNDTKSQLIKIAKETINTVSVALEIENRWIGLVTEVASKRWFQFR
jgi:hypothetical protein